MKRILLSILTITAGAGMAQVTDTVSTGAGYSNQCWYSLENDEQVNVAKDMWDLAFEVSSVGTSVNINTSIGMEAWSYPGDTGQWATLDTAGINGWQQLYNSDTAWYMGALVTNQSGLDLGWGTYSTITHQVVGDELFVVKLEDGSYQKLWIQLLASGVYTFRHASLDNAMDMTHTLAKGDFSGKNFGYFSLSTHQEIDIEPASADWDLYFGQYLASDQAWYNVSGVLTNMGTVSTKAYPVNDSSTYDNYSAHTFETRMNVIGYDWKYFDFGAFSYIIDDSTVFFVETQAGDIWKLIFTGFGGSSNGDFIFSKEQIEFSSVEESKAAILNVYPNPASDVLNLSYNAEQNGVASLIDLNGRIVRTQSLAAGLNTTSFNVTGLSEGMYILQVRSGNNMSTQKVFVK